MTKNIEIRLNAGEEEILNLSGKLLSNGNISFGDSSAGLDKLQYAFKAFINGISLSDLPLHVDKYMEYRYPDKEPITKIIFYNN
jgi:hypothetical protein